MHCRQKDQFSSQAFIESNSDYFTSRLKMSTSFVCAWLLNIHKNSSNLLFQKRKIQPFIISIFLFLTSWLSLKLKRSFTRKVNKVEIPLTMLHDVIVPTLLYCIIGNPDSQYWQPCMCDKKWINVYLSIHLKRNIHFITNTWNWDEIIGLPRQRRKSVGHADG